MSENPPASTGAASFKDNKRTSTTFSTEYSRDGKTWIVGPQITIGVTVRGNGPTAESMPFVKVYGCSDHGTYDPLEFISLGLAAIDTDPTTGTLRVSFFPAEGFAPSCSNGGSFAFPLPFGSVQSGVGQVTYDQVGDSFTGTVYNVTGRKSYILNGKAVSFNDV